MNNNNSDLWYNFALFLLLGGGGFFVGLLLHSIITSTFAFESEMLKIILTSGSIGCVLGLYFTKIQKK